MKIKERSDCFWKYQQLLLNKPIKLLLKKPTKLLLNIPTTALENTNKIALEFTNNCSSTKTALENINSCFWKYNNTFMFYDSPIVPSLFFTVNRWKIFLCRICTCHFLIIKISCVLEIIYKYYYRQLEPCRPHTILAVSKVTGPRQNIIYFMFLYQCLISLYIMS